VVYDNTLNDIVGLRAFNDTELLAPYLQEIEIPELY
jgi:hypothetical protein